MRMRAMNPIGTRFKYRTTPIQLDILAGNPLLDTSAMCRNCVKTFQSADSREKPDYLLENLIDIFIESFHATEPNGLFYIYNHRLTGREIAGKSADSELSYIEEHKKSVRSAVKKPPLKHIVVISGKGGTGKTTLTASFCALAKKPVIVDCDVDAADMHMLLHPEICKQEDFTGGRYAVIDSSRCIACGKCRDTCRFDAITQDLKVDMFSCEGCKLCSRICPTNAIRMADRQSGKWFVSDTEYGPLVHAALSTGEENSGKLVSKIKEAAFNIARETGAEWVIADGPPGTGCPVMASLSGANLAVIVAEPTLSAIHDMKRVMEITKHFKIPSAVVINKWDLNKTNTADIEKLCVNNKVALLGRISFNQAASDAISAGIPLVKYGNDLLSEEIKNIWMKVQEQFDADR